MSKLIKSDMYRILCQTRKVILLFIMVIIVYIVSILKSVYYDDYICHEDIFKASFENHMFFSIIIIFLLVYVFMQDYFDSRTMYIEMIAGQKISNIIVSRIIGISMVFSSILCVSDLLFIAIYYMLFGQVPYSYAFIRVIIFFILYIEVCVDSVLVLYLFSNFFIYVFVLMFIWILSADKMKISILGVYIYKFSYKYQLSIVTSFGSTSKMILCILPYIIICILLKTGILFIFNRIKYR